MGEQSVIRLNGGNNRESHVLRGTFINVSFGRFAFVWPAIPSDTPAGRQEDRRRCGGLGGGLGNGPPLRLSGAGLGLHYAELLPTRALPVWVWAPLLRWHIGVAHCLGILLRHIFVAHCCGILTALAFKYRTIYGLKCSNVLYV